MALMVVFVADVSGGGGHNPEFASTPQYLLGSNDYDDRWVR